MYPRERLFKFDGPFSDICQTYIEQNRILGYKYNLNETYLRQFDHFCIGRAEPGAPITKELFEMWTAKRSYESDATHQMRSEILSRFCRSLTDNGSDRCAGFYPQMHRRSRTDFAPYIFTKDEIAKILAAADTMTQKKHSPWLHLVLPVLLRLLYSSGLRLSEALGLQQMDVDLREGSLSIRDTKFDKSRKIPMSASMLTTCRNYATKMRDALKETAFFFPAPDSGQYAECTIYSRFRDMLLVAGIPHGGRGKGPRLHDFRHTFAVHSLQKLTSEGIDLYVTLPILSSYMGHKSLVSTQQYLHLMPEVYPEVTGAFEECFGVVFPEVPR